jgi:AraC-like DNA-binding protein
MPDATRDRRLSANPSLRPAGCEPPVAPIVFTTADLPRADRLDMWNAAFGALNDIHALPEQDNEALVHNENWALGGMILSVNSVSPARFERRAAHARRDGCDHWVIRVLRHGSNQLRFGDFAGVVQPGQPLLFSMHETWTSCWDRAEWVSLTIPRDLDPQLSVGLSRLHQGPIQGPLGALFGDLLLALPARLRDCNPQEAGALAEAARAFVAGCLAGGRAAAAPHPGPGMPQKERVRRAIRQHIGSARLTPDRLAVLAGLSRSSLYRLFEAEGGVARYVQSVRLSMAQLAICDPAQARESIAAIAEAHGFPDPSVFARAFKQAYGVTPREARLAAQCGAPPAPPSRPAAAPTGSGAMAELLYQRSARAA